MKAGYWFVLPWSPEHVGGVNQVVININNQLNVKGLNPSIFVGSWEDASFREIRKNDLDMRYGRIRGPLSNGIKGKLMYWLTLPATMLRLTKILREENVVCVNPHYPSDPVLTFVLLRKFGIFQGRLLISLHGSDFTGIESSTGFDRLVWHYILRGSDALVACSQSLANRISAKFPDLAENIKVIHNGFDPLAFEAEHDKAAGLPDNLLGTDFILNIGNYERIKGQDVLLQAFCEISSSQPALKLVLIGRDGSVLDGLRQTAEAMGLKDRVFFIKDLPHAKIAPFFEAAKFFVLPSRTESLPVAVLEAGAFGLPTIASRIGGLPEILTSPELGMLVEPDDPSALASAMRKVLSEPEWARNIGENLRRHVHSNFSWHKAVDSYLELLRPVLGDKR